MPKKILTVTLNPAIDTSLWVDTLQDGEISRTIREESQAGGKGVNISRTMKAYHKDAPAFFLCGEQNAAVYKSLLKEEGVICRDMAVNGAVRENIHIITSEGCFYKINRQGFSADEKQLHALAEEICQALDSQTLLAVAGSLPRGTGRKAFLAFLKGVSQSAGELAVDTSELCIEALCSLKPTVIKPNLEEFRAMTNLPALSRQDALQLAGRYIKAGIQNILLSFGKDGLALINQNGILQAQAPCVSSGNTVGAGDNALAGFLMARTAGLPDTDCLRIAAAFGTASVMRGGTCPPEKKDVESVFKKVTVSTP